MRKLYWQKVFVFIINFISILLLCNVANAKGDKVCKFSGIVLDENGIPIPYCTVKEVKTEQWSFTDLQGEFLISLEKGNCELQISCLGYEDKVLKFLVLTDTFKQKIVLKTKNYSLDNVVVTAKRERKSRETTTYIVDATAIEHTQISSLSGILAMLPGGRTVQTDLLATPRMRLRSSFNEEDNPSFGTAIEVDGIRLSNNGVYNSKKGIDGRFIATENIEKVEIITGIPSVIYGDLNSGIVRVQTKRGVMPFQFKTAISPRQKMFAFSRGFANTVEY